MVGAAGARPRPQAGRHGAERRPGRVAVVCAAVGAGVARGRAGVCGERGGGLARDVARAGSRRHVDEPEDAQGRVQDHPSVVGRDAGDDGGAAPAARVAWPRSSIVT